VKTVRSLFSNTMTAEQKIIVLYRNATMQYITVLYCHQYSTVLYCTDASAVHVHVHIHVHVYGVYI